MPDQIPDEIKHERIERLVEVVQRVAHERNADRVCRVEEVLVEGPSRTDPAVCRGRTRGNKTCLLTPPAPEGTTVRVVVEAATSQTLRGRAPVPAAV